MLNDKSFDTLLTIDGCQVPVGSDSSRHTTLGLLNKAKHFIKVMWQEMSMMIIICLQKDTKYFNIDIYGSIHYQHTHPHHHQYQHHYNFLL